MMSNAVLEERAKPTDRRQVWRWLSWGVVAIYWLGMFAGTHWPTPPHAPFRQRRQVDAFFGLLRFGLAALDRDCGMRRPVTLAVVATIVVLLAGYGAFDELTQPIVGRDCDFWDWVCRHGRSSGRHRLLSARAPWRGASRSSAQQPVSTAGTAVLPRRSQFGMPRICRLPPGTIPLRPLKSAPDLAVAVLALAATAAKRRRITMKAWLSLFSLRCSMCG